MDVTVESFEGYALLGSGGGRKLERIGDALIDRPAPQAIWPSDNRAPWQAARAVFRRGTGGTGEWHFPSGPLTGPWYADWMDISFEIRLTGFGNVGLFPEHTAHWTWMADRIRRRQDTTVLNLFAYTGGATLACAQAGATVTHLDAAKSVNGWAMANAERSGISGQAVRYIADDALKFVRRESRRGNRYDGIILDPPTFGRGTKGEVWKIERDLHLLCSICRDLLSPNPAFVLLTSHSPGVTPSVLGTLLSGYDGRVAAGEMLIHGADVPLPAGAYARWTP
ncbi:MAG: class I SAM-dependent methyltransferase [Myxococcota bacterium]|nr:class I SAM-dependent methyltransferase [Myxococcota bacterium]